MRSVRILFSVSFPDGVRRTKLDRRSDASTSRVTSPATSSRFTTLVTVGADTPSAAARSPSRTGSN